MHAVSDTVFPTFSFKSFKGYFGDGPSDCRRTDAKRGGRVPEITGRGCGSEDDAALDCSAILKCVPEHARREDSGTAFPNNMPIQESII